MPAEINNRYVVARLLKLVRIGELSVREALLKYPKDTEDESLIAAYHALIHYEADEDLRHRDSLYKEEQDDYIEFLSYILERGEDLPENIILNYKKFYDTAPILHKDNPQGFFKSFWKILNIGKRRD
ncbi:hypothetical protein HDR58_06740 [bacterium]|nr:hypothetical protein [bacterium]